MKTEFKEAIEHSRKLTESELTRYIPCLEAECPSLAEAEEYMLSSGGKRVRPFLTLEFCRALGGDEKAALPFACAIEMVHTYSLIHDDLPCMDDSDMRRGRPACHKKFGEATAVLAGDGLLTDAFGVCASNPAVPTEGVAEAVCVLSAFAGSAGMVGGQIMDLSDERPDADGYMKLCALKTGGLISAAALLGCIAAGADEKAKDAASCYAMNIGLAFQITDDLLDAEHGDEDEGKTTILSFMSKEDARSYAARLTDAAKGALECIPRPDVLSEFADYLLSRVV